MGLKIQEVDRSREPGGGSLRRARAATAAVMRFHYFTRKTHYWLAAVVALPIVVIVSTGLLLHWKKQLSWVQPPEQRGVGDQPALSFERMLEICRGVPQAGIRSWNDVNRIDVRPDKGMLKIWARSNWEVQLDSQTGAVLQVACRRSDTIEAIHDGSWFHPWVKLGFFSGGRRPTDPLAERSLPVLAPLRPPPQEPPIAPPPPAVPFLTS